MVRQAGASFSGLSDVDDLPSAIARYVEDYINCCSVKAIDFPKL